MGGRIAGRDGKKGCGKEGGGGSGTSCLSWTAKKRGNQTGGQRTRESRKHKECMKRDEEIGQRERTDWERGAAEERKKIVYLNMRRIHL